MSDLTPAQRAEVVAIMQRLSIITPHVVLDLRSGFIFAAWDDNDYIDEIGHVVSSVTDP